MKEKIGSFGVDSGTFWIGDLGYIVGHPEKINENSWNEICKLIGQNGLPQEIRDGVMISTGSDGSFPVYAHKNKAGEIYKIEVDFR